MKLCHVILTTLLGSSWAMADGGLCTDGANKFQINSPQQWKLDFQAAKTAGVCVFFYPPGQNLESTPALIYARVTPVSDPAHRTLDQLIQDDLGNLKLRSPLIYKQDHGFRKNKHNLNFKLVYFLNGPKNQEFQANAYFKTENSILVIALSATTKEALEKYLNQWMESIHSAHWLNSAKQAPPTKPTAQRTLPQKKDPIKNKKRLPIRQKPSQKSK